MKITLAQSDIIAAVKAHIASQGIALDGKSVDIKFTMKKGNAGVAADVSIESVAQLPDLSEDAAPQRPTLAVVAGKAATPTPAPVPTEEKPAETPAAEQAQAEQPQGQATGTDDAAAAPAAAKTTSLFN